MPDAVRMLQRADVLIIDSTTADQILLSRVLSDAGCRVRTFGKAGEAFAAIQAAPPDLILLELMPPALEGYQTCAHLKSDPDTCDIPVIFLSPLTETEYDLRAYNTGAVDYITKPLHMPQVLARIRTHMQTVELHRQLKEQNAHLQEEISERRRVQESLAVQAEELSALYRMGLLVTSGLELSHILDTLQQQLSTLMPMDVFYVGLYKTESDEVYVPTYYERDTHGRLTPNMNVPAFKARPSGFAAHLIRTRQMLYVPDAQDPTAKLPARPVHLGGSTARAYLGLPLIWKNQVIGLLSVQSYQPGVYTPDHIRLIQAVAVQAAIAIQNVHLYEEAQAARRALEKSNHELQHALIELERLATTDKLTGAFNRRKFDEILSLEMKRALRFTLPLSLIMFDIDHFKTINDLYGHHTGDRVLIEVVRLVLNSIRSSDTLTRWGGEEFLVLCPGNTHAQAVEMAERLRQVIAEALIPGIRKITISLGVSEFTASDTPDRFIMRADNELYSAKNNGRNRVGSLLSFDPAQSLRPSATPEQP